MQTKMIETFARAFLKTEHTEISAALLQRYIASRPEIGKEIPIEDIKQALEGMYMRGELELFFADDVTCVYYVRGENIR